MVKRGESVDSSGVFDMAASPGREAKHEDKYVKELQQRIANLETNLKLNKDIVSSLLDSNTDSLANVVKRLSEENYQLMNGLSNCNECDETKQKLKEKEALIQQRK